MVGCLKRFNEGETHADAILKRKRDKVRNKPSPLLKKPYIGIGLKYKMTWKYLWGGF